jgi:hypothetical protein
VIVRRRGVTRRRPALWEMTAALCSQPGLNYHNPIVYFFPEIT